MIASHPSPSGTTDTITSPRGTGMRISSFSASIMMNLLQNRDDARGVLRSQAAHHKHARGDRDDKDETLRNPAARLYGDVDVSVPRGFVNHRASSRTVYDNRSTTRTGRFSP